MMLTADDRADLQRALTIAIERRAATVANCDAVAANRQKRGLGRMDTLERMRAEAWAEVERFGELFDLLEAGK